MEQSKGFNMPAGHGPPTHLPRRLSTAAVVWVCFPFAFLILNPSPCPSLPHPFIFILFPFSFLFPTSSLSPFPSPFLFAFPMPIPSQSPPLVHPSTFSILFPFSFLFLSSSPFPSPPDQPFPVPSLNPCPFHGSPRLPHPVGCSVGAGAAGEGGLAGGSSAPPQPGHGDNLGDPKSGGGPRCCSSTTIPWGLGRVVGPGRHLPPILLPSCPQPAPWGGKPRDTHHSPQPSTGCPWHSH